MQCHPKLGLFPPSLKFRSSDFGSALQSPSEGKPDTAVKSSNFATLLRCCGRRGSVAGTRTSR
eukprot:3327629-Amphidinium_carterae.1